MQALLDDPALLKGLNVIDGKVVCRTVARDLGYGHGGFAGNHVAYDGFEVFVGSVTPGA